MTENAEAADEFSICHSISPVFQKDIGTERPRISVIGNVFKNTGNLNWFQIENGSMSSDIKYFCYPRSQEPPAFAEEIVSAFRAHEEEISTESLADGLKSDEVLAQLRGELERVGFDVERGKSQSEKIHRPVLFGEGGEPELRYEVDAYHEDWRCGLEIEAGRAWKGNAVYRDLIQGAMMVQVDTLALAVPNAYKYSAGTNKAFDKIKSVVETLYRTKRFELPYDLVLIGY